MYPYPSTGDTVNVGLRTLDLALISNIHFWTGALFGSLIDMHVLPRAPLPTDSKSQGAVLGEVVGQLALITLVFAWGQWFLHSMRPPWQGVYGYNCEKAYRMHDGFALGIGLAWTSRNLQQKVAMLMGDPVASV